MWGDNPNYRSVANCPIQGMGAVIMRKADVLAYEENLYVPFTLHDALYVLCPSDDMAAVDRLADCMDRGFRSPFNDSLRDRANIRLDCNVWSSDFPEEEAEILSPAGRTVKRQQIYIDPRSKIEYEKFSKYFVRDTSLDCL